MHEADVFLYQYMKKCMRKKKRKEKDVFQLNLQ